MRSKTAESNSIMRLNNRVLLIIENEVSLKCFDTKAGSSVALAWFQVEKDSPEAKIKKLEELPLA